MVRPTGRGWVMLLAMLGCIGTALVNVNLTTTIIAAGMMALAGSSLLLALFSLHGIELRRAPNRDGHCGSLIHLPIELINQSWQWRQAVVIREYLDFAEKYPVYAVAESLAPKEHRLVRRSIPAARRGFYPLNRIDLLGGDPAGFFCRSRSFRVPGEVMIYPQTVRLNRMPLLHRRRGIMSVTGRPLGVSGIGQEFFGVREYSSHDEMRFIHWKASARHKKLMVKEFEASSITQVYLLLDAEQRYIGLDFFENNFEFLISAAASISEYLADMHCRLTFISSHEGNPVRFNGEAVGVKTDIIGMLAILKPGAIPAVELLDRELDHLNYNAVFYCLTMNTSPEMTDRLELVSAKGIDVRWICAAKKNFPWKNARRTPNPGKKAKTIEEDNSEMPEKRSVIKPLNAAWFTEMEKLLRYE